MADRKPLIVLAVLAVLAIVLFVTGMLGPSRGGSPTWPDWASWQRAPGGGLVPADLQGGPGCSVEGLAITFTAGCEVDVRPVTGGLPWERVTRRAVLTATPRPVGLTITLAGKTLHHDLDAGEDVRLTFTRDGGSFALTCAAVGGCAVVLREEA